MRWTSHWCYNLFTIPRGSCRVFSVISAATCLRHVVPTSFSPTGSLRFFSNLLQTPLAYAEPFCLSTARGHCALETLFACVKWQWRMVFPCKSAQVNKNTRKNGCTAKHVGSKGASTKTNIRTSCELWGDQGNMFHLVRIHCPFMFPFNPLQPITSTWKFMDKTLFHSLVCYQLIGFSATPFFFRNGWESWKCLISF